MTENQIKELIAIYLFSAMAASKGLNVYFPRREEGVDVILRKTDIIEFQGKVRHRDSGNSIGIQMKTTTIHNIKDSKSHVGFDLETYNYDDLIYRKDAWMTKDSGVNPLLLIVLVLNGSTEKSFVSNLTNQYAFNGTFYWYYPSINAKASKNKQTQRIKNSKRK